MSESIGNKKAREAMEAAIWVTCSPHEWKWTHEQQVAMARYCIHAAIIIGESISDLERIVCVKEPDDGVILLSGVGKSRYDAESGCVVYDHEHFSPLGDALIALHKHLSSAALKTELPAALNAAAQRDERDELLSQLTNAVGILRDLREWVAQHDANHTVGRIDESLARFSALSKKEGEDGL